MIRTTYNYQKAPELVLYRPGRASPTTRCKSRARRVLTRASSASSTENISSDPNALKLQLPTQELQKPDGSVAQVMAFDYGFRSGAGRLYKEQYGEIPKNVFELAGDNFSHEWKNMRKMFVNDEFKDIGDARGNAGLFNKVSVWFGSFVVRGFQAADKALVSANALEPVAATEEQDSSEKARQQLKKLTLNDQAVIDLEKAREASNAPTAPWFITFPYRFLCLALDLVYEGRPIQRFWVLEEVARMPYFAYISMLHLYESLGWWRAGAALRKVHFAEEWNELHHCAISVNPFHPCSINNCRVTTPEFIDTMQIMESLGGDRAWFDRFIAQHSAILYFWVLILFYAFSPKYAYQFSELVEGHATDTYSVFAEENEEALKQIPPPAVAVAYYCGSDVYMFESFQVSRDPEQPTRKPECNNLYDVFINIRDDEIEHKKTMVACQDPAAIAQDIAQSS